MGERARAKPKGTRKIKKVMREFGSGGLKRRDGAKVKNRKEAVARALNQQRAADKKTAKRKRAKG